MSTYRIFRSTSALSTVVVALVAMLAGCIKNDIPYPRIQPDFTEFVVEGEEKASVIDAETRTVTIFLRENVDIRNVKVTSFALSEGHLVDATLFDKPVDLTEPLTVPVELYQVYNWTLIAHQTIDRYFTVQNQIGNSVIDVPARRVIAYVPQTVDRRKLKVTSIRLGSSDSRITPDIDGAEVDFSNSVTVDVTDFGRTEKWTIYVEPTETSVTLLRVDAWTNVAWLYGEAEVGKDNGFEYRKASDTDWTRVPADWITSDGGNFTGRLIHLEAECDYVARAYSDDEYTPETPFTTGTIAEIPNGTMDNWWLDGKVWNPWAEGGTPYWDTGNKGATTLGSSNTVPTDDTSSGTGRAAMLETRFVGIGIIGKLAAGNIFAGSYVKTDGTNGILSFGRPFTLCPTKLRGWLKYHSAPISSTTAGFQDLKNRPDTCIVWCALIDSDEPFEIRTNPNNRHLFDPDGPEVVAYGKFESGKDIQPYTPYEVVLEYKATNRKPKYILIVASASKYGDYFTGGNGSVLCVDDFILEYDY